MPALTLGLEVPASVRIGTPVSLKVTVQNTNKRPVALTLGGRPPYDVVVTTPDGQEVWRWSHGEAIQAILERKTLKPGETWSLPRCGGSETMRERPSPQGRTGCEAWCIWTRLSSWQQRPSRWTLST